MRSCLLAGTKLVKLSRKGRNQLLCDCDCDCMQAEDSSFDGFYGRRGKNAAEGRANRSSSCKAIVEKKNLIVVFFEKGRDACPTTYSICQACVMREKSESVRRPFSA